MNDPAQDPKPWQATELQDRPPDTRAATADGPTRRPQRRWRNERLALGVTVLALAAAAWFGLRALQRPAATPAPPATAASAAGGAGTVLTDDRLRRSIDDTTARLKLAPDDASAWAMLAHSQAMLGKFEDAKRSHARLAELRPNDAQVWADYADVAGMAQGRRLAGEPATLIAKALSLDPANLKALVLAGREAFERKAYGAAAEAWERARAATTDKAVIEEIEANIAEARAFDGRDRPPEAQAKRPGGVTIAGRVSLAPALKAKVGPDDVVFIFARPLKGSRMPVALLRRKAGELPLDFTLDDSQSMVPDIKLSMLSQVAVGARVSKRGNATPHAGDLQGLVQPVALGSQAVKVEISEVLP